MSLSQRHPLNCSSQTPQHRGIPGHLVAGGFLAVKQARPCQQPGAGADREQVFQGVGGAAIEVVQPLEKALVCDLSPSALTT